MKSVFAVGKWLDTGCAIDDDSRYVATIFGLGIGGGWGVELHGRDKRNIDKLGIEHRFVRDDRRGGWSRQFEQWNGR